MAEWGRKEYSKAWPSRRPVWTWGAFFLSWRVALDKVEGVVKAKITCAVRERRDLRQRG